MNFELRRAMRMHAGLSACSADTTIWTHAYIAWRAAKRVAQTRPLVVRIAGCMADGCVPYATLGPVINPRRACARVTVLGLCCLSVYPTPRVLPLCATERPTEGIGEKILNMAFSLW